MRTEYCTIGSWWSSLWCCILFIFNSLGIKEHKVQGYVFTLYAYSLIIHPLSKASCQFSHCELFSWYNEPNCEGSSLRWEFMYFQWKERSSQGPWPSPDGFEKTINNNCYDSGGEEGTTGAGQVRQNPGSGPWSRDSGDTFIKRSEFESLIDDEGLIRILLGWPVF